MSARKVSAQLLATYDGMIEDAQEARECFTQAEHVNTLESLYTVTRWADGAIRTAVHEARSEGQTWQTIAEALNVTKQAAQQKYGHTRKWTKADTEAGQISGQHALI